MDVKEAGPFPVKKEQFRMTVNGQEWEVAAVPTTHLSDLLRKEFQLTGTKVSCGIGSCGACSILIDGKLTNACMTMAYQVTTTPLQQSRAYKKRNWISAKPLFWKKEASNAATVPQE